MTDHPELICAYMLDGKGGGAEVDWQAVEAWTPDRGPIWIHLDCTNPATETWLRRDSGLDTFVVDGLLAGETRPRCDGFADGIMVILRGVNLNPGAEPEDMVSLRIWVEEHRVISTRLRRLQAIQDLRDHLAEGRGPVSPAHLVARVAAGLTERMGPAIEELGDLVADLEEQLLAGDEATPNLREVRFKLVDLRRVAITLRRYIAPQRDAVNRLLTLNEPWLKERVRGRLRETVDRVTRIIEELDEVRERSAVVQDELLSRQSQRMERVMYILTLVATVMMPLGFITGLLGINVGGIPGAENHWSFLIVCGGLALFAAVEIWLFKKMRWL
ncbi:MAG: zinc transporter ZntB [Hyphomicrobiales bacterium]|nr:zinc transporter ZntB [Hyphomicrobiales bacterium]